MINLGIIGFGPVWEQRYRPALSNLRHRIRIRAVFDPVFARCEQVACELGATPYQGVLALLQQADVRGVLVFDAGWYGHSLLHLLRIAHKPAYLAGSLGEDSEALARLRIAVEAEGLLVMPEFSRRFTPATCRLRELIATRIGPPRQIRIDAVLPAADSPDSIPGQAVTTDFLIGLLDWCRYVLRSATVRLEAKSLAAGPPHLDAEQVIALEFADGRNPARNPTAELRLSRPHGGSGPSAAASSNLSFTVICENGEAVIEHASHVRWSAAGGEPTTESLTADRSEVEVMIDHFCRRVVGGLVPVADISDVCHCLQLVNAALESLESRTPIELVSRFTHKGNGSK